MATVSAVNLVNVVARCSKTGKRKFASRQEAEQFEERNHVQYGGVKKYVYACDDCDSYHLSSLLPGVNGHSTITTNYAAVENGKAPSVRKQRYYVTEGDVRQMLELQAKGLKRDEIAARIGCSKAAVYLRLKKAGSKQHTTEEALDAQIEKANAEAHAAQERTRRLREMKERMIQERQVKVNKLADGCIQIRKQSQFIVLPQADCIALHGKLEEILTETAVAS
jgi:hypothetical protein